MYSQYFIHLILVLLLAPLFLGIVNRIKAKVAGRHGKPLLQLYFDLFKLLHRGETISVCTTWVFILAPSISLAATLLAILLLPLGGNPSPFSFHGDFFVVAYLLGIGRFAIVLAALDTGSPFEGMGASREACFSALVEPVLFLCFLALLTIEADGAIKDELSLSTIFVGHTSLSWLAGRAEPIMIPLSMFVLLLAENSRIPVDDPTTHLELTMIHEAMILDHSGPNLALIEYGSALKLWLFALLTTGLFLPPLPLWQSIIFTLILQFLMAVMLGFVESVMARLKMTHIPRLLGGAGALAALTIIIGHMY